MEIADQIKDIKTQFRLAMNGVASTQMREQGLIYKLNFAPVQKVVKVRTGEEDFDALQDTEE